MFSKSPVNQATSKAMLTQMISIVFRRMETEPVWKLNPLVLNVFINSLVKVVKKSCFDCIPFWFNIC
jgi:hypothetical protein